MPNFHTKNLELPNFPATFGESEFLLQAISKRDDRLVMCRCRGVELLIKIHQTKDGFLVKGDKITRPSNVAILQQALRDFRDWTNSKPFYSNIDSKKQKNLKHSPYLKDMNYFANEFKTDLEILVEVGFGSGRHLLYQAIKNPHTLVIGIEIHKPSIAQVLKQCELQNITNILVVDYDARTFLEFLKSNSVRAIFVHFPVPWDKKPHRRVISDAFISESKRVLQVGGTLELRTDSDNYFFYSFEEFLKQSRVELKIHKNRDLEISSKYEDRWKRLEKNIYDIIMTNQEFSKDVESVKTLKFEKRLDFRRVKDNFKEITMSFDGFFVHLERIYTIKENEGLIRVSFGSSHRNEHSYVYITQEGVSYMPNNILATKDNLNAHKIIEDLLWNM